MKKTIIFFCAIMIVLTACDDSNYLNISKTTEQSEQSTTIQKVESQSDTIKVILSSAPYPSPSNEIQLWLSKSLSVDLGIYLKVKETKAASNLLFCPTVYIPAGQKYVNFDLPDYRKAVSQIGSDSVINKAITKIYVQICGLENNPNNKFKIDCSILQINYDLINNAVTYSTSNTGFVQLGELSRSSVNFYIIDGGSSGTTGPIVPPFRPID